MQDPLQLMISTGKSRSFSKYEFLINSGEVSKNIYYIKEGVIRHFVNDSEGNEKTIRISKENDFFYSYIQGKRFFLFFHSELFPRGAHLYQLPGDDKYLCNILGEGTNRSVNGK